MGKKRLFGITSVSILILLILEIVLFATRQSVDTPDRLLSLGEKYLTELNYEQALVQFLKVIEIDPMNPRGYTGAAEAYVELGQKENAIEVLRQGLERTNDDRVRGMLSRLETEIAEVTEPEQKDTGAEDVSQEELEPSDIVQDANYSVSGVSYALDRLNVPHIKLDSDDARQVNELIHTYFQDVALLGDPNPGDFDSEHGPWYTDIDYAYYINGDILSVIIIKESGGTAPPICEVSAYNLNIKSGKLLSYGDLAACTGQDSTSVYDSFAELALRKVTEEYKDYGNSETMERDIAATYATNKAWFEAGRMPWFLNGDGKLCGFVYMSLGLVGSGNSLSCYTVDGQNVSVSNELCQGLFLSGY